MIGERVTAAAATGVAARADCFARVVTTLFPSRTTTVVATAFALFTVVGLARTDTPPTVEGPSFTVPISNVTASVGRDAMLACVVEGLANYKVAWLRVNTQTILTIAGHVITKNHRISVTHTDHRTWYLHIRDVKESDQGDYMCQINTDPMKSQVGYLQVVVPPDIMDYPTSTDMVVREGSNVTFRCAATGSPTPNITWRRESGELIPTITGQEVTSVEGSTLNITRVNRLHMGAYLCIASNGVPPTVSKRIALIVHFQPMIMIPNQLIGALIGQEITLECHSEAYPQSINYWTRDNREIRNGDRIKSENAYVDAYKVHMRLTIRNVNETHFGTYKCIANNSLGHTNGIITLYKTIPPTTLPPPTTTTAIPTVVKVEKKPRSRPKPVPSVVPSSNEIIDASQSTVNEKEDVQLRSRSKNGGHASASAAAGAGGTNPGNNHLGDEAHRPDKTAQSMSSTSTNIVSYINTNAAAFVIILLTALS